MKRRLLFVSSALALGALTGFLISDLSKLSSQVPAGVAAVLPKALTQPASAPAVKVASTTTAFGRLINSTVAVVSHARAQKPLPVGGLVLNQPVVIVHSGDLRHDTLAQGTAVSLVKNEGRFMSVRHDQSVLTIPRSAVAVGVVRPN
ncbi:MAG TPA: hypothetical protein VGO11_16105 [Chthoniobacteraceae bacterium]|jgi:hypothetical protein|nr:hypothetical protein [Chthoniobacteraceae bacterium]